MKLDEFRWREFDTMQIFAALNFAKKGGIAIHDNPIGHGWARGGSAAHMFGPDDETLINAALALGLKREWFQRHKPYKEFSFNHFDLKGRPLALAKWIAKKQLQEQTMSDEITFVTCEYCGHEQADMGKNVTCEECGEPIPIASDDEQSQEA